MTGEAIYEISQKSIIGERDEQQDSWFVSTVSGKVFAAVCDGMGGHRHGQTASMTAVETMKQLYTSKTTEESYPDFFIKAIDILDEKVLSIKDSSEQKPSAGTTILTVAIDNDNLFWLSVGDSRLYIIRNDNIARVTRDHNYFLSLDQMMENGVIDQDRYNGEALKGERLISYIGMGGVQIFDINDAAFKLIPFDIVILCTDGLYRAVDDNEILRLVQGQSPEEAIDALINESSKKFADNTTCVIIKYIINEVTLCK